MINYIKKYVDLTAEDELRLKTSIEKSNKTVIKQNIKNCLDLGVPEKNIPMLLANNIEMFLLNPNPQNNDSIAYKANYYKDRYNITPRYLIIVCSDLLTTEIYANSNALKVFDFLETQFPIKEVAKLIKRFPKIAKYGLNENSVNSLQSKFAFWEKIASDAEVDLSKLLIRHPQLIGYSIDLADKESVAIKIEYYKNTFNIDDKCIADQIYKFANFLGLDIESGNKNSVDKKINKLNELGFSNNVIGNNLKALGAPLNKFKIRYIICKNHGMSDAVFLNNKFMIHESKLYARAKFLENNKLPKSLIYACEGTFINRTKNGIADLIELYPLTQEAALKEEEKFNLKQNNKLKLSEKELESITIKNYSL